MVMAPSTPNTTYSAGGPQPTQARQGRHQQRYGDNGERLVAGCIPIRFSGKNRDVGSSRVICATDNPGPDEIDVLLVSSRAGKGLCFPKGGWEDDESCEAAARRETVEEAGVRGSLEEPKLGSFPFTSGKSSPDVITRHRGRCIAHMFVMHVEEELEEWPEGHERTRFWLPLLEASARCRHEWMRQALDVWIARKGWAQLLEQQQQQQGAINLVSASSGLSDISDSIDAVLRPLNSTASLGSAAASTSAVAGTSPPPGP